MYQLKMSREQIDATISELEAVAATLESSMAAMQGCMDDLQMNWKGYAEEAYNEVYQELKSAFFGPMAELLKSYPQTLRSAENNLTYKDEENASLIVKNFSSVASV
jgi:WXG100 family type VII secretion target